MKQKKSEITKERIFQAAVKMFREKGYSETRTVDITNEIGVSHGTFFTYFKTKENIIVELFNRSDIIFEKFFDEENRGDAISQLRDFIRAQFEFLSENFDYEIASIMYSTETSLNNKTDYLISQERNTYIIIRKIVYNGIRNEQFKEADIEKLTGIIHRTLRGVVFDWILHKGEYDLVKIGDETIEILLEGVKK